MGKKAVVKKNKGNPRDLGVKEVPLHKKSQKERELTLKSRWETVQNDSNQLNKASIDQLYNLSLSFFVLLKEVAHKLSIMSESFRQQLLIYLSQLIGTIATLYGKSKQPSATADAEATLAFQREVHDEIASTRLYYYSPEECETGHSIHDDPTNQEIGARITAINNTLTQMPQHMVKKLSAHAQEDLTCLQEIHSERYIKILNQTEVRHKGNKFNVFNDEKKYPNVFITDIPYKTDTLSAIKAALGVATDAIDRTHSNLSSRMAEKLFCVIRPPSHHAHHENPEGFCYASTVVYAGKLLMDDGYKVLFVDFDAHHGNGNLDQLKKLSQDGWYTDKYHLVDVYAKESYIANAPRHEDSNANMSFYPLDAKDFTGANVLNRIQAGLAMATNRGFIPDVILVSAGFDAVLEDKYGGKLKPEDFSPIGAALAQFCPHMISFLEGGYHLTVLPQSVKHYMLGTIGPGRQPAPHDVKAGLTFMYNRVKGNVAPEQQETVPTQKNAKIK